MSAAEGAISVAQATLAEKSKSFALAGRWLPDGVREDAAVLYAWCRQADDRIDLTSADCHARELALLIGELDAVYGQGTIGGTSLQAFQDVVRRHEIPRRYFDELVEGLAMDARGERYATVDELSVYCYRVAGTVGLMMARLMGVSAAEPLERAVALGCAMQLTNICRDVAEDAERGRLYVPRELLAGEVPTGGGSRPIENIAQHDPEALRAAVAGLLARADALYAAGWRGLTALPLRCAMAIAAAAALYREIGRQIARRGFDVWAGRAVVPRHRKYAVAVRAAAAIAIVRVATKLWSRRLSINPLRSWRRAG